jgi:hypothetical protein
MRRGRSQTARRWARPGPPVPLLPWRLLPAPASRLPWLCLVACALCAACGARPPDSPAPATPAPAIGPAPLRRLDNREYLNALGDLFPGQRPVLPELPSDTVVAGFENAAEVQKPSDVRIARYEAIANLYAQGATADTDAVRALTGCNDWSTPATADACAAQLVTRMGGRIFRRPLGADERDRFTARFQAWAAAIDFEAAVRLTLSAMLQSPQFLYRPEPPPVTASTGATGATAAAASPTSAGSVVAVEPYAMASRLSFFLWESVPDDPLLAAAARDELRTAAQLGAQAARMLADDRARRLYWDFHRQWLGLDRILDDEHLARTPEVDPLWTGASQSSAAQETRLFVENVLMDGGSFADILGSRRAWVNGDMARIYGISPPSSDPDAWSEVSLPATERAGLLTRVAFLAGYSHRGGTSPPLRGNAIQLRFLCEPPLSPPPGADLSMPVADPAAGPQTNRALFEARTSPAACRGCHASLNGFGFGLESYSASGAHQTQDHGLPVDARGDIHGTDVDRAFEGGVDLADALSRSGMVHRCATERWIRYALGRAPVDVEAPLVATLAASFLDSGGDVRALLMDIVTAPTFRMRRIESN